MRLYVGDGVTYRAELFRVAPNTFRKLEKEGHGYIVDKVSDDLFYVFNGVRNCLVSRMDIMINHHTKETRD